MKKEGDFNQNKDVTESWNDLSPHQGGSPKAQTIDCVISRQTHKGMGPIQAITHCGAMHYQFNLRLQAQNS